MEKQTKNKKKKHPVLKALIIIIIAAVVIGYIVINKALKGFETETDEAQANLIGTESPDFSLTTTDGNEIKLSETLREKDAVVLNLFATWCGPCEREFPEFEEVYQKYKDKIEIVSVSTDSLDSAEEVAKYKKDHGLSFPMGYSIEDNFSFVPAAGVPTTVVIDKDGNIMFLQSGAFANTKAFEDVVTSFIGGSYDGKPVYLYTLAPHTDEEYLPGVSFKLTSDDGAVTELTTGDDGFACYITREPHTYTVEVTAVPEGYNMPSSNSSIGPVSQWLMLKLSK